MYRFVTFWNLLLDDHQLSLEESDGVIRVVLTPRPGLTAHRFGHMLMLKVAHGIASWLVDKEVALAETAFVFERPEFGEDYSVLFPSSVRFGEPHSLIGGTVAGYHIGG